ncbi:MAG: hypothetical protein Q9206_005069 [Seirophora lacunosa]
MIIRDVPEKMLAAQVIEFNKPYKIHTIDTPIALSPYDLLLKTKVASLCHTDGMAAVKSSPSALQSQTSEWATASWPACLCTDAGTVPIA